MTVLSEVLSRARIVSHEDAARVFAAGFALLELEQVRVAHLDAARGLIAVRDCPIGSRDQVGLPLRAIVADVLALGTHGLLLAHNHPSGDPSPSRADLAATRALAELMRRLDVRLHDHLIFAGGRCASFKVLGLL